MKAGICGSMILTLAIGSSIAQVPDVPEVAAARPVAEQWLPLLDSGRYDECWQQLASHARSQLPVDTWKVAWKGMREPLGDVKGRKLIRAQFIKSLEGLLGYEGVTLTYEAKFANRTGVIEALGLIHEKDGQWRVGYYVTK